MRAIFVFFGIISAILLASGGYNASFTIASIMSLPILYWLVHRPQESPVLLFVMLYQWLQVSTKSFHASLLGIDVRDMMPWAPVDQALWYGLIGLLSVAAGLKLATFSLRSELSNQAQAQARRIDLLQLFKLHIGLLLFVELTARLAAFGGLSQAIQAIGYLRFVTLFVFTCTVVVTEKGYPWLIALLLAEVAYSFGGFFAGFKLPLFVTLLAVATVPLGKSIKRTVLLISLAIGTLYIGVLWQSIKNEYRDYVSQDSGVQAVLVDRDEQIEKLSSLIGEVNTDVLENGAEALAVRFAYVDMFAYTLGHVPGGRPHTNGQVVKDAFAHVLMPRLFFPDKPIIDDTVFTKEYTGLAMHSVEATSISIGYIPEAYIDFGVPGMFFWLFLLGVLFGLAYRWMVSYRVLNPVLRVALVTMLFLTMGEFGLPLSKLFGGFLVPYILASLLIVFGEARIVRIFGRHFGLNAAALGARPTSIEPPRAKPPL